MPDERAYDLVLLGATGYTGGLVADHLSRRLSGTTTSWAIAGRSVDRLEAVRDRAAAAGSEPSIETVDVHDLVGLLQLTEQTRVLATTVGPYVEHGELVVQACIRSRTDYCDITGEPAFVDRLLARYDGDAREQGVRVVNACGFDAIPHDLGARFTVAQLPVDQPIRVRGFVRARGLPSGGTWRSAIRMLGSADLRSVRGAKPRRSGSRRARGEPLRIHRVPQLGAYGVPLPTIDPAVVLRSARALDAYGPDFTYGHYAHVRQPTTVAAMIGGAGVVAGLARIKPTRDLLLALRPSGTGPSESQREAGWFQVTFLGEAGDHRVTTRVSGGDPGYAETAMMLGETTLSLAHDDDLPEVAGVVTTAEAFEGGALQRRLEAQGMRFEVLETGRGRVTPTRLGATASDRQLVRRPQGRGAPFPRRGHHVGHDRGARPALPGPAQRPGGLLAQAAGTP